MSLNQETAPQRPNRISGLKKLARRLGSNGRSVPAVSALAACIFIALFKASVNWPVIGGGMHLIVFWPPMLILIFLTSYRAIRKINAYVAEHITDHPIIKRIAAKPLASFLVAASLSVTLSCSMAVFTYTMSWSAFPIVVSGFLVVAGAIHALSFRGYLKSEVAEVSRGYIAVGAASLLMVIAYLLKTVLGDFVELDPMSPELIELVRETVNHPNYVFESVARTVVFLDMNVLSLGNVEGLTRSLVIMLLLLTTSAVPFVSLALFMRSLYEVVWHATTRPKRHAAAQDQTVPPVEPAEVAGEDLSDEAPAIPLEEVPPVITGINHITFSVKDLHASLAFYRDLLGMTLQVSWDAGAYLTAGDAWICLSLGHTSSADDYTHIAFSSREEGFDQLRGRLRAAGIQEWKVNTSEGDSLYVLDPDGHRLELHCGTLASRLADMRRSPYPGTLFAEESQ